MTLNNLLRGALAGVVVWLVSASTASAQAVMVPDAIWADGELYGTVATPTRFKSPPRHSTDALFNFAASGLSSQRSVSEASPGSPDYNGGRWRIYFVAFTAAGLAAFDPDGDSATNLELTRLEEVAAAQEAGLITVAFSGIYFECPLLPKH